jgi:hypothetical protein
MKDKLLEFDRTTAARTQVRAQNAVESTLCLAFSAQLSGELLRVRVNCCR